MRAGAVPAGAFAVVERFSMGCVPFRWWGPGSVPKWIGIVALTNLETGVIDPP